MTHFATHVQHGDTGQDEHHRIAQHQTQVEEETPIQHPRQLALSQIVHLSLRSHAHSNTQDGPSSPRTTPFLYPIS